MDDTKYNDHNILERCPGVFRKKRHGREWRGRGLVAGVDCCFINRTIRWPPFNLHFDQRTPFPPYPHPSALVSHLFKVLQGLLLLHQNALAMHRDLKPANILVPDCTVQRTPQPPHPATPSKPRTCHLSSQRAPSLHFSLTFVRCCWASCSCIKTR